MPDVLTFLHILSFMTVIQLIMLCSDDLGSSKLVCYCFIFGISKETLFLLLYDVSCLQRIICAFCGDSS